ncbi:hypothetical protein K431DRAFT_280429 [Polychaeton citri CBS 116435]|uniref:Secreted protein n=1 Tax=Polychaeton citri CBS 116435 TaxID=1314669 RepID=A0A9P4QFY5_9PEZI|nr:hypothetical protein K431DRAFT_280429 [Polychaeton citri CBS 116435]
MQPTAPHWSLVCLRLLSLSGSGSGSGSLSPSPVFVAATGACSAMPCIALLCFRLVCPVAMLCSATLLPTLPCFSPPACSQRDIAATNRQVLSEQRGVNAPEDRYLPNHRVQPPLTHSRA